MTALLMIAALAGVPDHSDYPGCNTMRCERRMVRKTHGKTVRRWRKTVAPHNAHLLRIAACESGGRWHINTGNGFYGGLQFTLTSWRVVGGDGFPHWATPLEQKFRAVRLSRVQGWSAWPVCGR